MRKSSSQSSPKATNTLLNYFNTNSKSNDSKTNGGSQTTANSAVGGASSSQSSSQVSTNDVQTGYQLYDLVWAKLEGYPWWPSIVCPNPTTNTHVKRKGKTVLIHVQFFDDPVSRAWIRERDLKEYLGKNKSDVPFLKDAKWKQSIEYADQALKMEMDKRWTLIADLVPSDEEEGIQLIDDEMNNHSIDELNKSSNNSLKADKESPKSNKKEEKSEHKSDLKRKNSQKDVETKDRKKFKRIEFDSSDNESNGSDDEFKVSSSDESEDVSEIDIKEIIEEESDLEESDFDSEPKSRKRSKSSKSSHKSKSKKKSNKTKVKKSAKKSKMSYSSESDMSEPSDMFSSDSEPHSKSKSSSKSTNKSKKSFDSIEKTKKKSTKISDSDVISVDSDSDSSKAIKEESTKAKSTPKNWLTERISAQKPSEKKSLFTPKSSSKVNKSLLSTADESFRSVNELSEKNGDKEWPHFNYEFLKPEKIKDKSGKFRLINGELNPDYDPNTLTVPESFLNSCTPAQRQWWLFKCDNYDTVLFFKMGKFYELFHMDADIAVNELQIQYMKSDSAHAGFPEKAYKRYADVLIQKNYKVARIEQTETPQMMEERVKHMKKSTKFDKVVNREMCRVSTIGTRMSSVIDPDSLTDRTSYLLAITENVKESGSEFGVCFIDVSIGRFNLSQFSDDRYCSSLRTLVAHNPPVELLFDRKNISQKTKQLIENCVPNARKELKKEFWSANKTLKYLTENDFFGGELPKVLDHMLDETDLLKQTPRSEYELAVRSLGAIIEFLNETLIAEEVLSMKLFDEYKPCDNRLSVEQNSDRLPNNMILDSFTLRNLEIFHNSLGGTEGTLNEVLDYCSTPFGKRLLHRWICAPLCDIEQIQSRQTAVAELSNVNIRYEVEETIKVLKKLPDLERLLSKIHSQGSAKRAKSHPDSRAIFFESDVYSKRKISDFLSVLEGFKQTMKIVESFQKHIQSFKSSILIKCLSFIQNGGRFPDLKGKLKYFDDAFDHKIAKQEGKVVPQTGADAEYDQQIDEIKSITEKLDQYLVEQRKFFGCKVSYFGTGKNRYQLEVPDSATKRISKDNKDYQLESSRKGFKRYSTPYIQDLFKQLMASEDTKELILRDIMRRIFETFDKHYDQWLEAIQCLSLLDVMLSLSKSRSFLQQNGSPVCQPKFSQSEKPFINLIESSNPCLLKYCDNFIPNDIRIESELLLLTGPNMGGKSTLMRQLGLIVVMAQIGAYVPAKECTLSPVDRIFTRIGAFDRIVEGESTFFVELSETALVLKHSTKHSLVLIDELGRGTSTFDGTAIACAVTKELSENIRCRTLFSSHYHSLVDEFKENPSVKLVHMACMIENENETDPTEESITFLYKLKADSCPKSYGFNAAQLAGIPKQVIRMAFKKAKQFERQNQIENIFRKVIENNINDNQVMEVITHLKSFSFE